MNLEEKLLQEEATDVSVTKQLGACWQYLDLNGIVCCHNLKLLELADGYMCRIYN